MLAAIELIEQIQKHLARDDADEIKLKAVVAPGSSAQMTDEMRPNRKP